MEERRFKRGLIILSLAVGLGAFQNCGEVRFANTDENFSVKSDTPDDPVTPPGPPPQIICDPFAAGNNIDPKYGIQAALHYTPARLASSDCANPSQCGSRDYIDKGTKYDAAVFMSQVYVPTRNFSDGFEVQGQGKLKDQYNNDLIEWFALDMKSQLTLSDDDAEGMYQFATVSDDGITLTVSGDDVLVDEGEHSPRLKCSSQVVPFKKGDLKPFRLTYFQGPRTQISLTLMWRKIDAQSLADCGTSDGYFGASGLPASLKDKGWKVLKPQNFKLKDGYNLCSMPAQ